MGVTNIAQDFLPSRISQYVPGMQYAADVVHNGITEFSLGTPVAEDDNGILDDKSATTTAQTYTSADFVTAFTGTLDGKYGRNITLTGTAGSNHVVTVTGKDYLGQVMKENLTLSGTTKIVGRKAFKFIDQIDVAAGASGDTFDMGWGVRLGLPYKLGKLSYAKEGSTLVKPNLELTKIAGAALTVSGANAVTINAPHDGLVLGLEGVVTTGVTTAAATLDAVIGGSGQATLDVTVPVAAAGFGVGNVLAPSGGISVSEGDACVWTSDGASAAGVISTIGVFAHPTCTVVEPDTTDPATATTDDTRGTYESYTTLDGSTEIIGYAEFDAESNSSGNGGLHGIAQFSG